MKNSETITKPDKSIFKSVWFWVIVGIVIIIGMIVLSPAETEKGADTKKATEATNTLAKYKQISDEDMSYLGTSRHTFRFTVDKSTSDRILEQTAESILKGLKAKYPKTELTLWFFSDERLVGKVGYDVAMTVYDYNKNETKTTFATEDSKKLGEMYLNQ